MNKDCPICSNRRELYFAGKILNKYDVDYFYCNNCGLLQVEEPYWLDEAYSDVIAKTDVGLVFRNIKISDKLTSLLYNCFEDSENSKYLDLAGGYGLLTRLMRDNGFNFYWDDPYCENLFAQGFELQDNSNSEFDAITAFEVFEHITNPLKFLKNNFNKFNCKTIIFTTQLFQSPPPDLEDWWYYALETGQHVSFYQLKTLKYVASEFGLNLYSNDNFHCITDRKLSGFKYRLNTGKISKLIALYVQKLNKSFLDSDYNMLKS